MGVAGLGLLGASVGGLSGLGDGDWGMGVWMRMCIWMRMGRGIN